MNRLISQGQAMRSILGRARVTQTVRPCASRAGNFDAGTNGSLAAFQASKPPSSASAFTLTYLSQAAVPWASFSPRRERRKSSIWPARRVRSGWRTVSGRVARLRTTDAVRKTRPHNRARGARTGKRSAGAHFIHVAIDHRKPATTGPLKRAAQTMSVRSRLMLPVSRFAPIGKPSRATTTAVSSGRLR